MASVIPELMSASEMPNRTVATADIPSCHPSVYTDA